MLIKNVQTLTSRFEYPWRLFRVTHDSNRVYKKKEPMYRFLIYKKKIIIIIIYLMYGSTLNQMASTRISRNNKETLIYKLVDIHFTKAERSCLHHRRIGRRLRKEINSEITSGFQLIQLFFHQFKIIFSRRTAKWFFQNEFLGDHHCVWCVDRLQEQNSYKEKLKKKILFLSITWYFAGLCWWLARGEGRRPQRNRVRTKMMYHY